MGGGGEVFILRQIFLSCALQLEEHITFVR